MPVDPNSLASKLRKYREHFQTSLNEVAAATGVAEEDLVAFESGQKLPTGDQILILADYFKCDFRFFISDENLAPFEQTETLFRKYGSEFSKDDRWAVQEFLFLCECEQFLMEMLPAQTRESFKFRKRGSYYKRHGEEAARELRQFLGYSPKEIPIDVFRDFRKLGFHVFRRQLANSNISGLYIRHPVANKCILINYSDDVYRQRFTAAHEAAHAILDDEDVVVSFVQEGKWSIYALSEIRANVFASRYLIPPECLEAIPNTAALTVEDAIAWADGLKVSPEALAYALRAANLISDELVSAIKASKGTSDARIDPELPTDLSPKSRTRRQEMLRRGLSVFYVDLCFVAYQQGIVSAGRLAEMLLAQERELHEIAEVYGRRITYGD